MGIFSLSSSRSNAAREVRGCSLQFLERTLEDVEPFVQQAIGDCQQWQEARHVPGRRVWSSGVPKGGASRVMERLSSPWKHE